MNVYLYVLCYGVLLGAYGFLAYVGKVPMDGFVTLLRDTILALGAVHIAILRSPPPPPPPSAPSAS